MSGMIPLQSQLNTGSIEIGAEVGLGLRGSGRGSGSGSGRGILRHKGRHSLYVGVDICFGLSSSLGSDLS